MIKILYIVSTLKRSGPIIVLSNIIKYLDRDKFDPIVLTLSPETKNSMREYFENELNIKVVNLGFSRIKGLFFSKGQILKFIKNNDINIIHSHGFRADGLVSKIKNAKSVSTLHNYPYYDYIMTYGKIIGYIMAKIHLFYLKKINEPRAVSKSVSEMLKKVNNYNIDFIRNGVDVKTFEDLDKKYLRNKMGIEKNVKIFISVGHLNNRKNPLTIIKAFKNAEIKNSKLIFLGDGSLKKKCLDTIKDEKDIMLVGSVINVHEYLIAADYFVSASLAEGLPNTVLEAMACGLPCILSNIPPHIEINEINKKSSLLFDPKDVKGLAEKLKEVINNDYELMSMASKEIVFNYLNAVIMSKKYQDIYYKLIRDGC